MKRLKLEVEPLRGDGLVVDDERPAHGTVAGHESWFTAGACTCVHCTRSCPAARADAAQDAVGED